MVKNRIILLLARIWKTLKGKDIWIRSQVRRNKFKTGNKHASWTICPDLIDHNSIILSFGVGSDISWEREIFRKFGCKIFLFDPTPSSIEWIKKQTLPEKIKFFPIGLSAKDGIIHFKLPEEKGYGSASEVGLSKSSLGFDAEVRTLNSIISLIDVTKIDILKMDIEGSEYGVVMGADQWNIMPDQILIEVHHRFPEVGVDKTRNAIVRLNSMRYKIFDVSETGEEYAFILER